MFNGDFIAMGQRAPTSDPEATPMKQSERFFGERRELRSIRRERRGPQVTSDTDRMEAAWRALAIEQDWLDGEMASNKQQELHSSPHIADTQKGACLRCRRSAHWLCFLCDDARWVCSAHPERPSGGNYACACGAPARPCPLQYLRSTAGHPKAARAGVDDWNLR